MKKIIILLVAISLFGCKEHYQRQSLIQTSWKTKDGKKSLSFSNKYASMYKKSGSLAFGSNREVRFTNEDGFNEFIIDGYNPGMATSDTTLIFNNETYIKVTHNSNQLVIDQK